MSEVSPKNSSVDKQPSLGSPKATVDKQPSLGSRKASVERQPSLGSKEAKVDKQPSLGSPKAKAATEEVRKSTGEVVASIEKQPSLRKSRVSEGALQSQEPNEPMSPQSPVQAPVMYYRRPIDEDLDTLLRIADIETSLRASVVKVLRPSIERISSLEAQVNRMADEVKLCKSLREEVELLKESVLEGDPSMLNLLGGSVLDQGNLTGSSWKSATEAGVTGSSWKTGTEAETGSSWKRAEAETGSSWNKQGTGTEAGTGSSWKRGGEGEVAGKEEAVSRESSKDVGAPQKSPGKKQEQQFATVSERMSVKSETEEGREDSKGDAYRNFGEGVRESVRSVALHARASVRRKDIIAVEKDEYDKFKDVIDERISKLETNWNNFKLDLSSQQAEDARIQREQHHFREVLDKIRTSGDEQNKDLGALRKEVGKSIKSMNDVLSEQHRKIIMNRQEVLDEVFGEGKGLSVLRHEVADLIRFVQPLPEIRRTCDEQAIENSKLNSSVHELHNKLNDCALNTNKVEKDIFDTLRKMEESFRHNENQLVAKHGELMRGMRFDYTAEITAIRELAKGMGDEQKKVTAFCDQVARKYNDISQNAASIQKSVFDEINMMKKQRALDNHGFYGEILNTRKKAIENTAFCKDLVERINGFKEAIGLLLQGGRINNALAVQDFADRKSERWIGLQSSKQPAAAMQVEELVSHCRGSEKGSGENLLQKALPTDWRAGLVEDAYMAGQVLFQDDVFERPELLLVQHKVFQRVHEALARLEELEKRESSKRALAMEEDKLVRERLGNRYLMTGDGNMTSFADYGKDRQPSHESGGSSDDRQPNASGSAGFDSWDNSPLRLPRLPTTLIGSGDAGKASLTGKASLKSKASTSFQAPRRETGRNAKMSMTAR